MRAQGLRDEQSEFPIAENSHFGPGRYSHLVKDFAGGGERLYEYRFFIGDLIRNGMQIHFGEVR